MDRRKSIKAIIVGTVSSGVLVEACKPGEDKKEEAAKPADASASTETNRIKEEQEQYK